MRRICLLLLFLLPVGQSSAQIDSWSIWLFDAGAGRAIQVDNAGVLLNDIILPVPAPYLNYALAPQLSISPDGTRIAYAINGTNSDDERISSFMAFDTITGRILFTYDTPDYALASSLTFSKVVWNSTGNILSFAYATGETLESQSWQIIVLNAIDGRVISDLNDASPYFASQSALLAPYLLPVLQFYGEASLGFNLIPYQAANFATELFSYEWDIVTGQVVQTNRSPRITGETLGQTGETITPIVDERINYDASYMPYTNAIHVYRPETEGRAPFFATRTYDILRVNFAENGNQVVVYAEDLVSLERSYLLVSHTGILRNLPMINAINNAVINTPDGFAYVIDNQTPFLINVTTSDVTFPQTPIWAAPENSRFVPVWATSIEQENYDAWIQLAAPIFPTSVIVTNSNSAGIDPNAVPTSEGITGSSSIITVDSVAVINTTSGDRLNMRDSAGLNSNVIARVDSGSRVVVTAGPVAEDGFTWWQIRLSTGQVGWVVERAEGVQTLLPAG